MGRVPIHPLALAVGACRAAFERSLTPVQSELAQIPADLLLVLPLAALRIRVLDPEDVDASEPLGVEPVEQCSSGSADVEVSRW